MAAKITKRRGSMLTIELSLDLNGSMLDMENHIQEELNKAGCLATVEALKKFDTDGSAILIAKTKLTARKQPASQSYECPYGTVKAERYLYQSNEGGYTYCPLEDGARIVQTATPRYAQIISDKYSRMRAGEVREDLFSTLRRSCSRNNIQNVAQSVASIARLKEDVWEYDLPQIDKNVASIGGEVAGVEGAVA